MAVDGAGALVRQLLDFLREDPPDLPVGRLDLSTFARRARPALEARVPEAVGSFPRSRAFGRLGGFNCA